jgi:hypothetical protein
LDETFLFNVNSLDDVNDLVDLCRRFKNDFPVDILCGRYSVDGTSTLGVASLLGNAVEVNPITSDWALKRKFFREMSQLKGSVC